MVKHCEVEVVFRIKSSTIDLDLTEAQAFDLYHQLKDALFNAPHQPKPKKDTAL